jgi:zinc/manganese transport system substrate-binding protein
VHTHINLSRCKFIAITATILILSSMHGRASDAVNVFACEPEWAALAKEIGGERVKTFSATHAAQDPHHIRARPSLLSKVRRADLVFCSGAGLEVGWLPILLERAPRGVQPGTAGYLMAADHVAVIEKPVVVDRSLGDLHPEGNPHVHLKPENILILARKVKERLLILDPPGSDYYENKLKNFTISWSSATEKWQKIIKPWKNKSVVVHHKFWSYFLGWSGLREVGTLESKPGISPSVKHLQALTQKVRKTNVVAILRTTYDHDGPSEWLSSRTNIPVVVLPATVDRNAKPGALVAYFDQLLSLLETKVGRL